MIPGLRLSKRTPPPTTTTITTTATTTTTSSTITTTSTTTTTRSTSVDPYSSLSPANRVIHRCRQAVSGDPGVRLQQIDKCASLSPDAPFAMLRFPQNQITNNFIFTPPAMTAEPKTPLSNCGGDPRKFSIKHLICNFLPLDHRA